MISLILIRQFNILFETFATFICTACIAREARTIGVQRHNLKENKNLLARSFCRFIDPCDSHPSRAISLTFRRNLLSTKLSLSSIMDEFTLRVFRPTLLCMLGPKPLTSINGERYSNNARSGTQTSSPS